MKSTIDVSKILAKKQVQKQQNFVNNIRFEYQIKTFKDYESLCRLAWQSQEESFKATHSSKQNTSQSWLQYQQPTFLACVLQQYNKYNKQFYQKIFNQQLSANIMNVADYIHAEQFQLEKKALPTAQSVSVIFFPILPEVEKIIVEKEHFKDVSLQYEQSQVLNETVYTQKVQQPQYINKLLNDDAMSGQSSSAYTLTEMLTQFQKLIIKLLENRNKITIYTGEDFKKYIQNIMYQLE